MQHFITFLYGLAGGILSMTIVSLFLDCFQYDGERGITMLFNSITLIILAVALVCNGIVAYKNKSRKKFLIGLGVVLFLALLTKFSFFIGTSL